VQCQRHRTLLGFAYSSSSPIYHPQDIDVVAGNITHDDVLAGGEAALAGGYIRVMGADNPGMLGNQTVGRCCALRMRGGVVLKFTPPPQVS
jgi:hypothetical protein